MLNATSPAWQDIRVKLEHARQRIQAEITRYPAPIPACDADFNFMLEERARLCAMLDHMHDTATLEAIARVDAYLLAARYLDDGTKRTLRTRLREARDVCGRNE